MTNRNILDTPVKLVELHSRFAEHGHQFVFVGGPVRDSLMGITPKDIDCATSATPDEAIAIYRQYGYSYHETGLQHGTVTVVLDHIPYEITSFRIDAETDGRHAEVVYTRDLAVDLSRRDLTMNAIAMGFDGEIFDPFGGVKDIEDKRVRFVGDAKKRLEEDYLRILRFFRFYARFADVEGSMDRDAYWAIIDQRDGLQKISVERIWSEVAKIIAGPHGEAIMTKMAVMEVADVIGLPSVTIGGMMDLKLARGIIRNPAFLMAAYYGRNVLDIATRWKWSNEERRAARFLIDRDYRSYSIDEAKRDVYEKHPRELVSAVLRMGDNLAAVEALDKWVTPVFPVSGQALIQRGMTPGPALGAKMEDMRERWIASDYQMSGDELLA